MRIIRNWQTSLAGLLGIAMCVWTALSDPARMSDPLWQNALVVSGGLLLAKDANKSHTQEPLKPPNK